MAGYPTEGDLARERELIAMMEQAIVAAPPERFELVEGVPVVGVLRRVETAATVWGQSTILVLAGADGLERQLWVLQHKVLREELEAAAPQIGDVVGILFEGKRAPKKGDGPAFNAFRVRVMAPGETKLDWSGGTPRRVGAGEVEPSSGSATDATPPTVDAQPVETAAVPESCPSCGRRAPFHETDCPNDPPPY